MRYAVLYIIVDKYLEITVEKHFFVMNCFKCARTSDLDFSSYNKYYVLPLFVNNDVNLLKKPH